MSQEELPFDKQIAIAFARAEFDNDLCIWPSQIVLYAERCGELRALTLTLRLFKAVAIEADKGLWLEYLTELESLIGRPLDWAPEDLEDRVRVIWNDNRDRSWEKKGISRLFGALDEIGKGNFKGYERQLCWSLGLYAHDGNRSRLERTILEFDQEFP